MTIFYTTSRPDVLPRLGLFKGFVELGINSLSTKPSQWGHEMQENSLWRQSSWWRHSCMFTSVVWVTLVLGKHSVARLVVMVHFVGGSSSSVVGMVNSKFLWGTAGRSKKGGTNMIWKRKKYFFCINISVYRSTSSFKLKPVQYLFILQWLIADWTWMMTVIRTHRDGVSRCNDDPPNCKVLTTKSLRPNDRNVLYRPPSTYESL